ncbi:hypothetical protein [Legionella tunisiensis]|uniref:hypothetical protein n=1 Tax=Legionella tunisiensis TaxID=1034944 RepID=UPI0002EF9408|nr:hypothetical protein [Legionella tunisiensis]
MRLLMCYFFWGGFVVHANATEFAKDKPSALKNGHATIQMGGYWRTSASQQFIQFDGLIGDKFTVTHAANSNGLFGVGYFVTGQERDYYNVQYGLNWFYLPKTNISGTVIKEGSYENLTYGYHVTQYPFYAIVKSTIKTIFSEQRITLNAGIGPNFIQTSHFDEYSILNDDSEYTLPDNIFSGKTTTQFSATLGAGIQFNHAFGQVPLECGYQFYYLGQGKMRIINDQVLNPLKTGTLYANAVMCSITI